MEADDTDTFAHGESGRPQSSGDEAQAGGANAGNVSSSAAQQAKVRKRTKTGCLTCRKRRIKCGEERPTCNNCIKSKRNCEGYNQRVVWKQPLGDWPLAGQPGTIALTHHTSMLPGSRGPVDHLTHAGQYAHQQQHFHHQQQHLQQQPFLTPIQIPQGGVAQGAPPSSAYPFSPESAGFQTMSVGPWSANPAVPTGDGQGNPFNLSVSIPQGSAQGPVSAPPLGQGAGFTPIDGQGISVPMPWNVQQSAQYFDPRFGGLPPQEIHQPEQPSIQQFQVQAPELGPQQALFAGAPPIPQQQQPVPPTQSQPDQLVSPLAPPPGPEYAALKPSFFPQHEPDVKPRVADVAAAAAPPAATGIAWTGTAEDSKVRQDSGSDTLPVQPKIETVPETEEYPVVSQPSIPDGAAFDIGTSPIMPAELLEEAAVEFEDDDYYDVQSDEEMNDAPDDSALLAPTNKYDFGLIVALHREHNSEIAMRRYDAFIYEGILDTYRPERVASPLRNPRTARVFAHFCHATGPSLSIYERNPRNPSAIFSSEPVPYTQQSLWTYKLPMMALNHQGLLHAMLALASLHIAKLQGAATTPSYKHYAYALKRIKHCVGHPRKKYMVTTLAATLLLAYYEVATASHGKWSAHLMGAKQLMVELDFKGMTKEYRRLKAMEMPQDRSFAFENPGMVINQRLMSQMQAGVDSSANVDENLVGTIIGRKVRYDEFGSIVEEVDNAGSRSNTTIPPEMDLSKFELFQDLFWWYCRHDAYHSIISGDKLLMDYSRWSDCPPRARMGRADAIYGTHDHLLLLLGRISDFAARDRERKIKAIEMNGGFWRPPPGMQMPGPPGSPSPAGNPGMPPGMPPGMQPGGSPGGPPGGPPPGVAQQQGGRGRSPITPTSPNHPFGQKPPGFPPNQGPPPPGHSPHGPPPGTGRGGPPPFGQGGPPPGYGGGGPPGQGGPPPGFGGGGPPGQGPPPGMRGPPPMPSFYGMAPSAGRPTMPSYYASNKSPSPGSPQSPQSPKSIRSEDLESATKAAIEEWNQIQAAINVFQSNLGEAYQPLPPESYQRIATPFGDAAQYRSLDISVLWALLYMSRIIAIRSHPHMPPAATMAAGIAAAQTGKLANEIGRIAAGILPTPQDQPLNPSLGASLCEITLPVFFAGVQYQNPAQRSWLVTRCRDIGKRTGWESALMIAHGCETAWVKAFEMGRGPEYIRVRDLNSTDERILKGRPPASAAGAAGGPDSSPSGADATNGAANGAAGPGDSAPSGLSDPFGDRRFVHFNTGAKVHWAMGLLSLDDDIRYEGAMEATQDDSQVYDQSQDHDQTVGGEVQYARVEEIEEEMQMPGQPTHQSSLSQDEQQQQFPQQLYSPETLQQMQQQGAVYQDQQYSPSFMPPQYQQQQFASPEAQFQQQQQFQQYPPQYTPQPGEQQYAQFQQQYEQPFVPENGVDLSAAAAAAAAARSGAPQWNTTGYSG